MFYQFEKFSSIPCFLKDFIMNGYHLFQILILHQLTWLCDLYIIYGRILMFLMLIQPCIPGVWGTHLDMVYTIFYILLNSIFICYYVRISLHLASLGILVYNFLSFLFLIVFFSLCYQNNTGFLKLVGKCSLI